LPLLTAQLSASQTSECREYLSHVICQDFGSAVKRSDPRVRVELLMTLQLQGLGDVDFLLESLRDSDARVRLHAAAALAKLGDDRGVPVLKAALQDTCSNSPRETAAVALAVAEELQKTRPGDGRSLELVRSVRRSGLLAHQTVLKIWEERSTERRGSVIDMLCAPPKPKATPPQLQRRFYSCRGLVR